MKSRSIAMVKIADHKAGMTTATKFWKNFTIFAIMGALFMVMEIVFRVIDYPVPSGRIDLTVMSPFAFVGYTSLWMFLVGGLSGFLIGQINYNPVVSKWRYGFQVLLGGFIIVALELISGLILNVWLDFDLWNYSYFPLNFMGQICVAASALWVALTPLAMWLDDVLRFYMGDQPKPDRLVDYYLDIFKK